MTVVVVVGVVAAVALLRGERGGFDTLNGRWLRLNGGYVLEIGSRRWRRSIWNGKSASQTEQ